MIDPARQPVIIGALRTPIGRAYGTLASIDVSGLLAPLIQRLVSDAGINGADLDDIIVGNAAGNSGNIARLAGLAASLPYSVPGVTVDRQCGSGLEAIVQACRLVQAGAGDFYLAGGAESLSTAPWRVEKPKRPGALPEFFSRARFSPDTVGDPDMGIAAENVAEQFNIARERQDALALSSHQRAVAAKDAGRFRREIVPLQTLQGICDTDECPRATTSLETLARLKPVFKQDGTVTAGNACPLNDGAALVLITSEACAKTIGISDYLVFVDAASAGVDPNILGIGPVPSTGKLLERQPWLSLDDVDYLEFNEAFASQVLASLDLLGIEPDRVNKDGGALALGHPFGASGAILVTRLFSQMVAAPSNKANALGLAMLGIGGGLGLTALFKRN